VYTLSSYRYELPRELIARKPADKRDCSRLLVLDRKSGKISHRRFYEIPELLNPEDVLVLNNTMVVPARLVGRKESGGKVEVLVLNPAESDIFDSFAKKIDLKCLVRSSKRPAKGCGINFDDGVKATVVGAENGKHILRFDTRERFDRVLEKIGKAPLPPYIRRDGETEPDEWDRKRYQTVYASRFGAVAAPTAGLHFTRELLDRIREKNTAIAEITLHVGYGTFAPVRETDIRNHKIHSEWFEIPEGTAALINRKKSAGGRVVAVGTTCVRALEYAADETGRLMPGTGDCDLFIYRGYDFKMVDGMITNFHLPETTLLMLVSAFAGRRNILRAYETAVENRYRFFSYGDAMLIA
jgi:S-adenosylmethionine:tRNA ribosyltransferase-isomerase